MLEFKQPIPVITPFGDGYAVYVSNSGTWENDVWVVALCDGGQVHHFMASDIKIYANATFGIKKQ